MDLNTNDISAECYQTTSVWTLDKMCSTRVLLRSRIIHRLVSFNGYFLNKRQASWGDTARRYGAVYCDIMVPNTALRYNCVDKAA